MRISKKKLAALGCTGVVAITALAASWAWLTSEDQVTNKLATDGRLDTSIVEVFNPPEEWTPGQDIEKDVAVANNGDVDAFIRVQLGESIETNVESAVATAGTENAYCYTDEQIAKYTTTIANGSAIPSTITVKMNENKGYIAYVTATKQKVNLEGIAYTNVNGKPTATVTGDFGITYATLTNATNDGVTFDTTTAITTLSAGQKYDKITLTAADVECLTKYANSDCDNLYLSQLGDGTPIVIVMDEDWTDNWTYGGDGYFYYNRICPVGETTESLVSSVILLPEATNDWANAEYDLTVTHEGIQAAVACIKDVWGADVTKTVDTAIVGNASISTVGAISTDE